MLAIRRGASLVFRAHDPLDRCEIQLSERIVLIPEKTLSTSAVLDRIDPYVHHLAAYERLDPFRAILGKQPQSVHVMWSVIDAELCK